MDRLRVAVIFGGCSSEYSVSLESAYAVITHLDQKKYQPLLIGINKKGDWFLFRGEVDKIRDDTWYNQEDCIPAAISPNKGSRKLMVFEGKGVSAMGMDVVFPVLHGRNGEDGTVQGLIELAGIPLVGCGTLASALCMDKDRAHRLVRAAGIRVPRALVLSGAEGQARAENFAKIIGYPLFVKPVKSGSSYGVTKVQTPEGLASAVELALHYDDQVILEEAIEGFEVGCAILGADELIVGEVDEIELSGGFFDFTEKYTLKTSAIHVPARIPPEKAGEIKAASARIYRTLGCSGFARVDCFLTPGGEIVFNEVNTIPGFTEHSRYPGMMKAAGYSFPWILDKLIDGAVKG